MPTLTLLEEFVFAVVVKIAEISIDVLILVAVRDSSLSGLLITIVCTSFVNVKAATPEELSLTPSPKELTRT